MRNLKTYLRDRRADKARVLFSKGFGYAMAQYYIEGEPLDYLTMSTEQAKNFGKYNPFDAGIDHAVELIESLKEERHDKNC